jgi:hypothetical protein
MTADGACNSSKLAGMKTGAGVAVLRACCASCMTVLMYFKTVACNADEMLRTWHPTLTQSTHLYRCQ